jgi:hypothetical protein
MPQFYELRQYHLRTTMRQDFSDYLKDVSVPALNRAGISPVGVFTVTVGPELAPYLLTIPADLASSMARTEEAAQLRLVTNTWNPAQLIHVRDERDLGVMLDRIEVK